MTLNDINMIKIFINSLKRLSPLTGFCHLFIEFCTPDQKVCHPLKTTKSTT